MGVRHNQGLLVFLGLVIAYAQRVNLSVGIVAMTDNSDNLEFPAVNWTTTERSAILSAFFYGYFILQIPSGLIAGTYGPCLLLAGVSIACGLFTIIIPFVAIHGNWMWVFAARVAQGLAQGCIYPSVNTHMSKWAVPQERNKMFSYVFGGTQFGTIIMLMTGGLLAASPGGWPSIYYTSGVLSIAWGVLFMFFGADSPAVHKTISESERNFIQSSMIHSSTQSKDLKFPWGDVIKSIPLAALLLAHIAQNWGFWTLLTLTPTYIKGVLNYNIQQNGFLSALPYVAMWLTTFLFGFLADVIIKKQLLSVNFSRKFWNSVATYGAAFFLVCLAYLTHGPKEAITFLTLSVALNAGVYSGYLCNHLDLSPNFAGTLMGITNGLANVSSILGPMISGILVPDLSNVSQWKVVFLISAAIFIVGNTIFIIFGSTNVQHWNEPRNNSEEIMNTRDEQDYGSTKMNSVKTSAPVD